MYSRFKEDTVVNAAVWLWWSSSNLPAVVCLVADEVSRSQLLWHFIRCSSGRTSKHNREIFISRRREQSLVVVVVVVVWWHLVWNWQFCVKESVLWLVFIFAGSYGFVLFFKGMVHREKPFSHWHQVAFNPRFGDFCHYPNTTRVNCLVVVFTDLIKRQYFAFRNIPQIIFHRTHRHQFSQGLFLW